MLTAQDSNKLGTFAAYLGIHNTTKRQDYKLWQVIVTPGANADVVTLKNGSTAQSIVGVAASGASVVLPFSDVPWAFTDTGNALTVNSGTTITKITLYDSQD